MRRVRSLTLALTFALFANVADAQQSDPVALAQQASEALQLATTSLNAAQGGKDRVDALTVTVRAYEDGLRALRDGLRSAAIRERVLRLELENQRGQVSRLLGVLQTLERAPTPLLMIHPTGPVGTARSGMMLSEVTPALHAQAEELRAKLEELLILQSLETSAEEDLRSGLDGVQQARLALSQAISDRTDLPIRFVDDPVKVQILADNSQTLASFANALLGIPLEDQPAETVPFTDAKGKLPLPTPGKLLRGFRESDASGLRRPGILVSARPLSLVTTPWPATIRYLGPLLDYGNVIILEPDAGYLVVLAGLDQVYGEFGQILDKGEPVGLLGGAQPQAEEFLIEAAEGGGAIAQETLYIEIREAGEPTDPAEWFAFGDN